MLSRLQSFISFLAILTAFLFERVWFAGEFETLKFHHGEACRLQKGVVGAEDIELLPLEQVALITSDNRSYWPVSPLDGSMYEKIKNFGKNGSLYLFDFQTNGLEEVKINNLNVIDFHPHGIGSYRGPNGEEYIGVVNHQRSYDSVEIFLYNKDDHSLDHLRSVTHPIFRSINDIVLLSPDEFIVSTWQFSPSNSAAHVVETLLTLPFTYVSQCKFENETSIKCHKVIEHRKMANGLAIDTINHFLYIADSLNKSVSKFHFDQFQSFPKNFTFVEVWPINSGPDNLMVFYPTNEKSSCVLVASHPKLFTFLSHQKNPINDSPSQIFRLCPNGKKDELLLTDGNELSGSSGVTFFKNTVLIGGVFDDGILICNASQLGL